MPIAIRTGSLVIRHGSAEPVTMSTTQANRSLDTRTADYSPDNAQAESSTRWSQVVASFGRPYPVTPSMIVLVALIPLYVFIPEWIGGRALHVPELGLDRLVPLQPVWALIYGPLYLFLIILPVLVVREQEHLRRTVYAYLLIWITAYAGFLLYPTQAPRTLEVAGEGFAVWGLRLLYSADPPTNCFPSLHVAHSFVSAFTCHIVHRRLGTIATMGAAIVAVSTMYTRQHYVLDVIAGLILAGVAYAVFLRGFPRDRIPAPDRRLAPALGLVAAIFAGLGVAGFWVAYRWARTS